MKEGEKCFIKMTYWKKIGHFHEFETHFASLSQLFGFQGTRLIHANASQMRLKRVEMLRFDRELSNTLPIAIL